MFQPGSGPGQIRRGHRSREQYSQTVLRARVPWSAAAANQVRAPVSPAGPAHIRAVHQGILRIRVSCLGDHGQPVASSGQVGRIRRVREQRTQAVPCSHVPSFGCPCPPVVGRSHIWRIEVAEQYTQVVLGVGVTSVGSASARRYCDRDVVAQVGSEANSQRVFIGDPIQHALPGVVVDRPGAITIMTVVGGYQAAGYHVARGSAGQHLGAEQGGWTIPQAWYEGPLECGTEFMVTFGQGGVILYDGVAGEGE